MDKFRRKTLRRFNENTNCVFLLHSVSVDVVKMAAF